MRVELDGVGFKSGDEELLSEISCTIEEGQCVLVMGPSGSGKTLLMKVMATIVPPSAGSVAYDGVVTGSMSDRDLDQSRLRHGFVFQDAALWQNLNVLSNLTLPMQYHFPKKDPAEVRKRVAVLCRAFSFNEDLNQRPSVLSGGERKVASIIRAMMMDPEIYFMDQPDGGLDGATSARLLSVLKDLKSRGKTLVIATHSSEIASQLADWILVVDEGRLAAYDSVQKLVRTDDTRVREILKDVFDLSSTYDADILDILGSGDDPFS